MKKIFITGISGTGKTAVTAALQNVGYRAISLDEEPGLCHWYDKINKKRVTYRAVLDKEFISAHEWICDEDKLRQLLDSNSVPVFVLGMAENQAELLPLFDTILLLSCRPEIFIARIMQREDNEFGQEESAQKYILETYQKFEKGMVEAGAVRIDAEPAIPEVVAAILRTVGLG